MPQEVVNGAILQCSMGFAPASFIVLPTQRTLASSLPAATIKDHIPLLNIPSFGLCNSTTNPAVIAATAAALGVHTPAPCIPATTLPWVPGSPTVQIGGIPALNNTSTCNCMWAGVISVNYAGQPTVDTS